MFVSGQGRICAFRTAALQQELWNVIVEHRRHPLEGAKVVLKQGDSRLDDRRRRGQARSDRKWRKSFFED
jgi:hypothetical protein